MGEWPRIKAKDVCSLIVDCVNRTAPTVDEVTPYRMIRTTNIRNGRIDLSTCRYVDFETFKRWTRRASVDDGDVLLTREAPIGEVGYVQNLGDVFLGQRTMQYRADPQKIDSRFLYYSFLSPDLQHQFGSHDGSGSVVSHIRVGDCHEFELNVPPLDEQKAIANVLSALDDKIELNRRTNETLEAMAQATFKDWFVDFGPVHRKQAGETYPTAILGGLLPPSEKATQTAALFPDTFGESGLPEGWGKTEFGDLCNRQKKSLKPEQFPTETFEHFSLPAYDKGLEPTLDSGDTIKSNKTIVTKGSVLLSKLNPETPRVWFPDNQSEHRQISSTEFLVFEPNEISSREYLYCLFNDPSFRQILTGMVTGTSKSHQRVSPTALEKIEVLEANPSVLIAFSDTVGPIFSQRLNLRRQNQTLAQTRDYLLPKLMSGQIRAADADAESMVA